MNKTEQKVLETLKNGFGLTSAEQEILANYIDKLQKENENLNKKNKRYEKYLKNKDIEHEKVLEYIETEKERDYISKDKIREYIKGNKRVYEMQTPNRNRVVYKDCVLLTSEVKELLGE